MLVSSWCYEYDRPLFVEMYGNQWVEVLRYSHSGYCIMYCHSVGKHFPLRFSRWRCQSSQESIVEGFMVIVRVRVTNRDAQLLMVIYHSHQTPSKPQPSFSLVAKVATSYASRICDGIEGSYTQYFIIRYYFQPDRLASMPPPKGQCPSLLPPLPPGLILHHSFQPTTHHAAGS